MKPNPVLFMDPILAAAMLACSGAQAAEYSSQAGTAWFLASTWAPIGVPGGSDTASGGHAIPTTG